MIGNTREYRVGVVNPANDECPYKIKKGLSE
jgi:ribosome modulation factor